jgi:hypothetical protein
MQAAGHKQVKTQTTIIHTTILAMKKKKKERKETRGRVQPKTYL